MGKVHKFLSQDLTVRAAIVIGTEVVREMQSIQNTYPLATMAVGRSMMAAALMASHLKNHQMVSLYFRGDGPLQMFFAEASFEGEVRGFTANPQLQHVGEGDAISLKDAIGGGLLTVVRSTPNQKSPQRGTVAIQTGEVAEDVAHYLMQSHQIPSIVSLGVKVNAYGLVQGAGGLIIELMPGSPEGLIRQLESNFANKGSLSEIIATGGSVEDIKSIYLKDVAMTPLDHPYELAYKCRCSKERLGNALALLGHLEVEQMIEERQPAHARCEFCGRQYVLEIDELQSLLEKLRAGLPH